MPRAFETIAARMLAREGIEVIWRFHLRAAASHYRGNRLSAPNLVGMAETAERLWRLRTISEHDILPVAMFFRFPPDARWNADHAAVEFGIGIGEYDGTVRVGRRVFQSLLCDSPTPQRCLEAYHLHRTRLELVAERKVRRRQLTDDGNVEITGRDLRERGAPATAPGIASI